jgi:hypothetical protein
MSLSKERDLSDPWWKPKKARHEMGRASTGVEALRLVGVITGTLRKPKARWIEVRGTSKM